jgi:hypothetical protein
MRGTLAATLGLVALCAAGPLAAQQPEHGAGGAPHWAQHHAQMEQSDRLLEQKLAAVDSLKGVAKVDALAAVVKELVAQRSAMHARMSEGMKGMMGPCPDSAAPGAGMERRMRPGT